VSNQRIANPEQALISTPRPTPSRKNWELLTVKVLLLRWEN